MAEYLTQHSEGSQGRKGHCQACDLDQSSWKESPGCVFFDREDDVKPSSWTWYNPKTKSHRKTTKADLVEAGIITRPNSDVPSTALKVADKIGCHGTYSLWLVDEDEGDDMGNNIYEIKGDRKSIAGTLEELEDLAHQILKLRPAADRADLEAEEVQALQDIADLLAGDSEDLSPDVGLFAWPVLEGLLNRLGVETPMPKGA